MRKYFGAGTRSSGIQVPHTGQNDRATSVACMNVANGDSNHETRAKMSVLRIVAAPESSARVLFTCLP